MGSIIDNRENISEGLQVKGITNLDNVAMFNVSGRVCGGMVGMATRVFRHVQKLAFRYFNHAIFF